MKRWWRACAAGSLIGCAPMASASHCADNISGYTVAENSAFEFSNDGQRECFFAFNTDNPDQQLDPKGCGNTGDTLWFARVRSGRVIELDRPAEDVAWVWNIVDVVDAVSFADMDGDGTRDIAVIGGNSECARTVRIGLVFLNRAGVYTLDVPLMLDLLGNNEIDIAGIRQILRERASAPPGAHGPE